MKIGNKKCMVELRILADNTRNNEKQTQAKIDEEQNKRVFIKRVHEKII